MPEHSSQVFALFENLLCESGEKSSRIFTGNAHMLTCSSAESIGPTFSAIEKALTNGQWVVLAADYEFGYLLEEKVIGSSYRSAPPLLTAYIFDHCETLTRNDADAWIDARLSGGDRTCAITEVQPMIGEAEFINNIWRIQKYINDGDCYQVNYTFPLTFDCHGLPLSLYSRLRTQQPVHYAAYIETMEGSVISLSPELFLRRKGNRLVSKPMKGTAARGKDNQDDDSLRTSLATSDKDRAENVMIVDLIRNDLGRVAKLGSVRVEHLFEIESYPTVFQMTSTVSAELRNCSLEEIFRALFPCGSITGAPKVRAMQIIAELERMPRGIYTGTIGYIAPNGDFEFNVAIRTLALDQDGHGKLGIGSGIVADSKPEQELGECLLKSAFLTQLDPGFKLIETLLYQPEHLKGYPYLDSHLERLSKSARYFGFPCAIDDIRNQLLGHAKEINKTLRVRLLLDHKGACRIESTPLATTAHQWKAVLSEHRVDSNSIFFYHKTTHRAFYDAELARVASSDIFDVLFCNERGELTEGARSNLVLKLDGRLYTPPLSSGLLNGVMRRNLLANDELCITEKTLYPTDLVQAEEIYLCNAVRGFFPVQFLNQWHHEMVA